MDTQTMFFAIGVAYAVFAVLLLVVERPRTPQEPLAVLAFAFACIGGGVLLQTGRGTLPDILSLLIGNLLAWIGLVYMCSGVLVGAGRSTSRRARVLSSLIVTGYGLLLLLLPGQWQLAGGHLMYAVLFAATSWAVLGWRGTPARLRYLIAGAYGLVALLYLLRTADAVRGSISGDLFVSQRADVAGTMLYPLLYVLALTTGFGLLLMSKKTADEQLSTTLHEQRTLLATLPTGILTVRGGHIVTANPAMETMLGVGPEALRGVPTRSLYASDEEYRRVTQEPLRALVSDGRVGAEARFVRSSGEEFWVWAQGSRLGDDPTHALVSVTDISELKALQAELERQASIDDLTGLPNRRSFLERAQREVAGAERTHRPLCFGIFDLDHFKLINDTFGHAAGDSALVAVARACSDTFRDMDLVARFGGDEFAIALPDSELQQGHAAMERLRGALGRNPLVHGNDIVPIRASIGIVEFQPGETVDEVMARADRACYASKESGGSRVTSAVLE